MQRRDFLAIAAAGAVAPQVLHGLGSGFPSGASAAGSDPIDARAFHAMRRFATTSFGRIAYVERGKGDVALFLHGLPLNGFQWRGALERLSDIRRCLAPDAMGLGYSEVGEGQSLTPADQAAMVAALLDRLGLKTVDLVASDSGGAIAQIFLARFPMRVRTLMLTNCDVAKDSPPPILQPLIAACKAGTFVDEVLAPQLQDKTRARSKEGLGSAYTNPANLTDESLEVYLRPLTASPLRKAQFHRYCIGMEPNPLVPIEPQLRASQVPVRAVWGTGDTFFAKSSPEELARIFPKFRGVRRVEGAQIFWPEERPEIVAEEARRLWTA